MPQPGTQWIPFAQVMAAEGVSRREIFNRCNRDDPACLIWKRNASGRGRVFDVSSLSEKGRQRWLERQLAKPNSTPQTGVLPQNVSLKPTVPTEEKSKTDLKPTSHQLLPAATDQKQFDFAEMLPEVAALAIPEQQKKMVWRRYQMVTDCINGNFREEGYRSKRAYLRFLSGEYDVSARSIRRWITKFQAGGLMSLANDRPGPGPGDLKVLDDWMVMHIKHSYLKRKRTVKQTYDELLKEIRLRQKAWGCEKIYPVPSRSSVYRVIRNMTPLELSLRQGNEAFHAATGYLDRTFEDERSNDTWCIDEWRVDALVYDPDKVGKVGRPWILTIMDERSRCILGWMAVSSLTRERVLDLLGRTMQQYGKPYYFYSDRGGHFRGKTFGGRFQNQKREKLFESAMGVLDALGIQRKGPRVKNPRANPIERLHRQYADWARTIPGWCGANTEQRKMTDADRMAAEHDQWVRGRRPTTPLITVQMLVERFWVLVDQINHEPSNANGLKGLSPSGAFRQFLPQEEELSSRRLTPLEITFHLAERFPDRLIQKGGIIQLPDKKRYSHRSLLQLASERRDVKRDRRDHSGIFVLPAEKGEDIILADLRVPVGTNDQALLSEKIAELKHLKKIAKAALMPHKDEEATVSVSEQRTLPPAEEAKAESDLVEAGSLDDFCVIDSELTDEPDIPFYDIKECTAEEE